MQAPTEGLHVDKQEQAGEGAIRDRCGFADCVVQTVAVCVEAVLSAAPLPADKRGGELHGGKPDTEHPSAAKTAPGRHMTRPLPVRSEDAPILVAHGNMTIDTLLWTTPGSVHDIRHFGFIWFSGSTPHVIVHSCYVILARPSWQRTGVLHHHDLALLLNRRYGHPT